MLRKPNSRSALEHRYNKTWSAGDEAKVRTLHEHLRDRDRKFWIQRGKTRGKGSVLMTKGKRAKTATRTMSDRDRHRTRTVRFETMRQDRASRSAKSAAVYRMRRENAMRLVRRGNNRSVDVEMDIIRRQRRAQTARLPKRRAQTSRCVVNTSRKTKTTSRNKKGRKIKPISMFDLLERRAQRSKRLAVERKIIEDSRSDALEVEAYMREQLSKLEKKK